ncbi:MAG: response regulator [Nitrospirota bacterium]
MKSVLVVDDSATTRSLIKAVIDEIGEEMNVVEAGSGFEALRLLPQHAFDLILTDINMPDINGLEFTNFAKNDTRYVHIPIIIVSTEKSREDIEKGLALGAIAYVTKPFRTEELQGTIRKVLKI